MNVDEWLRAFAAELHQRRVAADTAGHVVAETAAHLRDDGGDPWIVFGPPREYAAVVVESIGTAPGPRPGPVRLHAQGITKRYGRRTVLRDATLTVRAGQIAAVVGANGCGKSTFLRICAGLVSPDAGEVTVSGRLGYCPQQGGTADFLLPDEHFVPGDRHLGGRPHRRRLPDPGLPARTGRHRPAGGDRGGRVQRAAAPPSAPAPPAHRLTARGTAVGVAQ